MEETEAKGEKGVQRDRAGEMVARGGWLGRWACWEEALDTSWLLGSRSWW
jgi:hypothetical protein